MRPAFVCFSPRTPKTRTRSELMAISPPLTAAKAVLVCSRSTDLQAIKVCGRHRHPRRLLKRTKQRLDCGASKTKHRSPSTALRSTSPATTAVTGREWQPTTTAGPRNRAGSAARNRRCWQRRRGKPPATGSFEAQASPRTGQAGRPCTAQHITTAARTGSAAEPATTESRDR